MSRISFIRIFIAAVIFHALIQATVMQSIFIKNLSVHIEQGQVKTLDQLLDLDFNLIISNQLRTIFKNADGSRMSRKIQQIANGPESSLKNHLEMFILNEKMAILFPEVMALSYIYKNFDNDTMEDKYKIVPEAAFKFYESIMVPKNSPFQDKFNQIIQNTLQAGIQDYQLRLADIELEKLLIRRAKGGNIPKKDDKVITVYDLKSVFVLYLTLNFVAILVLVLEISWKFCRK
jgi:hypothetical protein